MSGKLAVTLVKGKSGRNEYVHRVLAGLGLTRINRTVYLKDTPEIRGMVEKVKFLVRLEETGEAK
jgi:large subunit ribosomal protein L30